MQYLRRSFSIYPPGTKEWRERWEQTFGSKKCQQHSTESESSEVQESGPLHAVETKES